MTVGRESGLRGHILDLEALRTLDSDMEVRRRPNLRYEIIERDTDTVQIKFHGKVISLPARTRRAIEFIATGDSFAAWQFPGPFDQESKLVIVRRLLREGFLTTSRY